MSKGTLVNRRRRVNIDNESLHCLQRISVPPWLYFVFFCYPITLFGCVSLVLLVILSPQRHQLWPPTILRGPPRLVSLKPLFLDPAKLISAVLSTLPYRPEENSTSPIPFFHLIQRLKTTKRAGWCRFGIENGESISDHMYRMSIMTMMAPPSVAKEVNIPRCIKMALIHDMAEALVGDITPADPVTKPEKARREASVMDYITTTLLGKVPGGVLSGKEIKEIFEDYEANTSKEAEFVHDIDKIELLLQMVEYERSSGIDLTEFTHVKGKIQSGPMKEWADKVMEGRPKKS